MIGSGAWKRILSIHDEQIDCFFVLVTCRVRVDGFYCQLALLNAAVFAAYVTIEQLTFRVDSMF